MEPQARLNDLVARLKDRGCPMTPQRMAVIRALVTSRDHPSVEQLYAQVKADFPMTSLATIYKTLTLLKEMGEVLEISLGDGTNRYDGAVPGPHPHLICVRCRRIADLVGPALSRLPTRAAERSGYQVLGYRLDFFGVCPQCQENTSS